MYRRAPRTLTGQFLGGSGGRQIFQFIENRAQKFGESVGIGGIGLRTRSTANIGSRDFGAFWTAHFHPYRLFRLLGDLLFGSDSFIAQFQPE